MKTIPFWSVLFLCALGFTPASADDAPPAPKAVVAHSAELVSSLLGTPSVATPMPAPSDGYVTFYDPGLSIEALRALPAMNSKYRIDALTHIADGQPWYVGEEFVKKTDPPCYRQVQVVASEDPGYVLVLENGEFASARVVTMMMAIHLLATDGGRLFEGTQWANTSDTAPGLRPACMRKRVWAAYVSNTIVLEPFYYGPAPECPCPIDCDRPRSQQKSGCQPCQKTTEQQAAVQQKGNPTLAPPQQPCCGKK